jgi:hypothetical protein
MADRSADEITARSRERFAPRAGGYRESPLHAAGPDLDLLVELVSGPEGFRALDVATGGGHVALALARAGADVTACDLTPEMLDVAGTLLAEHGCQAAYVVARVLVPGGRFGFQDQTLPPERPSAVLVDAFERLRDPSHNQAFSVEGWITQIERAGLGIDRFELIGKRHDFADWTIRQDCDAETVAELAELMAEAPPAMREWLAPEYDDGRLVAFHNRHLVVLARKP